jgi:hypothetical protein
MDIEEWWHGMRANPLQADLLSISQQFLTLVQWVQPVGTADPGGDWLQLPGTPGQDKTWEHATWIKASDLTGGMIRGAVQTDGYVLDDHSWSSAERVRAVARARGDFVALLGPDRRFERLVDRRSLLEEIGKATVTP